MNGTRLDATASSHARTCTRGAITSRARPQWDECLRDDEGRKGFLPSADQGAVGPPGGRTRNRQGVVSMKHKLFRLGLTVAMLAVLVESLGAPMKWG